ncbi:MAG: alpha-L-fucosidase [bacterium]
MKEINKMKRKITIRIQWIGILTVLIAGLAASAWAAETPKPLCELQRDLANLRFGMFIHLSPATYLDVADQLMPDHAAPRQGKDDILGTADDLSPALVNPTKLDCGQWADAAKSAGMKFGVLTTKHHDGFCLWPSKVSDYTVAQGCKRDIVREFTDAFRQRGLKVGLYYSIRDRTAGIADQEHGGVSPAQIQFIKDQLTELLTNYGPILYLVFDAWGNNWHESPTFADIPYPEIYRHIKSLQPDCLVLNHSRLRSVGDVLQIELNAGMVPQEGTDWPAVGGDTMQRNWFWRTDFPTLPLRSVAWIKGKLNDYNQRNMVFQLNCAPNRDGLMDSNVVARLAEVGEAWTPPPPLETIPASWRDWPVPSSVHLFTGTNIARSKAAHSTADSTSFARGLTDGDPFTVAYAGPTNVWWEVDLGQSYPLAGIHLWNRAQVKNDMLERGFIFVSEMPFSSDDPATLQSQPGVTTIVLKEAPGYPTPYPVGARGRYVRVFSSDTKKISLGELEIFAEPAK